MRFYKCDGCQEEKMGEAPIILKGGTSWKNKNPTNVWPWIIPLEMAIEVFGQEIVDRITEEPVLIKLDMSILP